MSSTTGAVRIDGDKYYTPHPLADAIVEWVAFDLMYGEPRVVLEPSVGSGAFAFAVDQMWPSTHIIGVDIDPSATGFMHCKECHACPFEQYPITGPYDLTIGNPPFSLAEEHAAHANEVTHGGLVVLLLRSAFMHGRKRRAFWDKYPARKEYRLVERPSFTGNGTDSAEYSVFVWTPGRRVPFCETERRSWK